MTERQFAPGDTIYREGDKSDFAYIIRQGRVEILKTEAGEPRQITVLGEGEIFGEMGVILDQRRSVGARALDRVVLHAISRMGFLHAVNQQSDLARPVLKTLLSRLHAAEEEATKAPPLHAAEPGAEGEGGGEAIAGGPSVRLRLLPQGEYLERLMRSEGMEVSALPFRVGRNAVKGEPPATEDNDLSFEDFKPFNLSRRHFVIEESRRGLVVRDCGSRLGTVVNGIRIGGKGGGVNLAALKSGDNEIIAGTENSPYRFTLHIAAD